MSEGSVKLSEKEREISAVEEKRQASEPAANEGASLSTATVAAAAGSTVSTVHHHNHLDLLYAL